MVYLVCRPDALRDYDDAIQAVPVGRGRAALHANRAQIQYLLGDLPAAEVDYVTSIELGHIPATAKLRALRNQMAAGDGGGGSAAVGGAGAVPVSTGSNAFSDHLLRLRVVLM